MSVNNSLVSQPKEKETVITTDTGEIRLSNSTVRNFLVNGNGEVTDQEIIFFIALCKAQKLNPFNKEAYLIKFGTKQASMVVAKDVFQKRADKNPNYNGKKAGVIVRDNDTNEVSYRNGAFYTKDTETVVGGWCEVFKKDREHSERVEVAIDEYIGKKSDGTPNVNWSGRPATMIRKVAVVQALREAFTGDFQGMYIAEEFGSSEEELPKDEISVEQEVIDVVEEPQQSDGFSTDGEI